MDLNETQKSGRTALGEITNNSTATHEAERKREERNRKQREYRARREAEETDEQREERNKRRREQRLFNRTVASGHGQQTETGAQSSILRESRAEEKENVFPDENMDWLHRNHNYVRTRQPTYDTSCVLSNLSGHTPLGASAATPVPKTIPQTGHNK